MSKWAKFWDRLSSGQSDNNIDFSELAAYLERLGWNTESAKTSHQFYKHPLVPMPVNIQTTTFEAWAGAAGQHDLVMSATAFHWVSPEIRYLKSAQSLAPNGWLALFWNMEAEDQSVLGQEIQAIYDKYMPPSQAHPYATHHPCGQNAGLDTITSVWQEEIEQSRLFKGVTVLQFPWTQWYATEQYLQLLETFSDHRTLPSETKNALFDGIAETLDRHGGGRSKPYLTVLYLAQAQSPQ